MSWMEEANCKSMDVQDLTLLEEGDPGSLGTMAIDGSLRRLNIERLKRSSQTCEGCPVKDTCLDTASPADQAWTVRGGLLPTSLRRKSKGTKKYYPSADVDQYLPLLCPKGHSNWGLRVRNGRDGLGRYCIDCSVRSTKEE